MQDDNIKTDINIDGWVGRLPEAAQPYAILMRLDRPIGWWLLFIPGLWGIVLGANGLFGFKEVGLEQNMYASDVRLIIYFLIGAALMRGAGCIINDLWDRDLDKQVERTSVRPLATGQVSILHTVILLFSLVYVSFIILLQTSSITIWLGILCVPLIVVYPFMKRITWWPQAFLGITFNMGALMGWAAATNRLDFEAFALYAAGICWTLGYDTIYAHQDKEDDAVVGIKSTARLFGDDSDKWVSLFYTLTVFLIVLALLLAGAGLLSYLLLILPAIHLMRQVQQWHPYDSESSLAIFKSNRVFGLLVLPSFALMDLKLSTLNPELFASLTSPLQNLF